ncbi:hypothetical protein [Tepidibacter hydrothermalis]|uniref:Uncharacterized protein n=1 Tax=Tepidibacter hydrothermalis TaxID=3036126 RepID=A0ABY8EGG9_9FIRM|nr:hypothetical protein [Tepidibacter hydrothermalis]WFD12026.1 hypothetical protein P4S50_08095 [Tepidibacter hydrothermalis]
MIKGWIGKGITWIGGKFLKLGVFIASPVTNQVSNNFKITINELNQMSWDGLVTCIAIGGILYLIGSSKGGKRACKLGGYLYIIIKLTNIVLN